VAVIRVYTFNEKGWLLTEPPKLFQNYTNRMPACTHRVKKIHKTGLYNQEKERP
jgi:hypothetical protein